MSLNEKIIKIRCALQSSNIKKSGKNKFQGFTYYELSDFLPMLNVLMEQAGVNDCVSIRDNYITLTLISGEERQEYSIPFIQFETPLSRSGKPSMQDIQYLGALNTYYKRYLYLNAFGITDGEVIDAMDSVPNQASKTVSELSKRNVFNYAKNVLGDENKAKDLIKLAIQVFGYKDFDELVQGGRIKFVDFKEYIDNAKGGN